MSTEETRTAKLNLHLRQAFPHLVIRHRSGSVEALEPKCTGTSPSTPCTAIGRQTRFWGQLEKGQLRVTDIRHLTQDSCKSCSFG